jgi:hypothetical protein
MDSMLIPFIMLLILTIALILERKFQEEKIVEIYEDKLKLWKENTTNQNKQKDTKELVGLVFLENSKLNIEVMDKKVIDTLERKKYTLSKIKGLRC